MDKKVQFGYLTATCEAVDTITNHCFNEKDAHTQAVLRDIVKELFLNYDEFVKKASKQKEEETNGRTFIL